MGTDAPPVGSGASRPKPALPEAMLSGWQATVDLMAEIAGAASGLVTRVEAAEVSILLASGGPGSLRPDNGIFPTPRAFCEAVLAQRGVVRVSDAAADPAWRDRPDPAPGVAAYLGLPLAWPDGTLFGTLCVLDSKPHEFPDLCVRLLERFKERIEADLALLTGTHEARCTADALTAANARLQEEVAAHAELVTALRRGEERFRSFFESPVVGVAIVSPAKGWVEVNDALCEMLGYPREELLRMTWTELTHPDDLEMSTDHFRRMLGGEYDVQSMEKRYVRKDGRLLFAHVATRAVRRPDGSVEHFVSLLEDITQRKQAEEEVVAYRQHLEALVAARTAALTEANQKLVLENARREKVEDALRESVQRFETVFREAPFGIVVGGLDRKFREINPAVQRLLGYSLDELNELGLERITHPDDEEANLAMVRELYAGRRDSYRAERRYLRKDGAVVWCTLTASMVRDEEGQPLFVMGIIEDVTQRREAEEALRRSEERFRAAQEISLDGFVVLRAIRDESGAIEDFVCEYANPAACQILNHGELTGKRMLDEVPGMATQSDLFRRLVGVVETGVSHDVETYYDADGIKGWFRNMAVKLDDGLVVSFGDITARKASEQERLRLATAVEQAAEAILITNAEGIIEYVNPAFERISGYTREEALGQTPRLLKSGKQDADFYRRMWETVLAGQVWRGQLANRRKDGALYVEQLSITPLRQDGGAITHFVAIVEDVSERQQLEEQFRRAQKLEAVGRLAGGVAHDFNNLLTAILGSTELLETQLHANDPLREEVLEIKRAGERAASLTRQLLAFSRRQLLQPRLVHLNDTVSAMEKMIRRLIGEDIRLESRLAPDLRPVKADPGQIEQVLLNLVVNARDAMPSGGRLVIETRNTWLDAGAIREAGSTVRQGEYVEVAVYDTGSGIAEDVAAHIFEPFFTTKEEGKGTGLGLSTVYGIARQSGGYVAFDSVPGRGTAFRVYFPATEGLPEAPAPSAPAEPLRGHETILVAEDEEMVRTLICRVLRLHGYTVLETRNGPEALAVLKGHEGTVHLLLSDIIMPGMYGPELAAQAVRHRPDLRILFVSGHADRFMAEQGGGDGAALILPKPFTPDALTRAVRAALG